MTVDEQIAKEVEEYVDYCRKAANHDSKEEEYRSKAHQIFYHILELRSMKR